MSIPAWARIAPSIRQGTSPEENAGSGELARRLQCIPDRSPSKGFAMPHPATNSTAFLDAAGEACGTVTPLIKGALAPLQPGQVLEVLAHDPATRVGVPAWCRLTGHELVNSVAESDRRTRFWIRKRPLPVPST